MLAYFISMNLCQHLVIFSIHFRRVESDEHPLLSIPFFILCLFSKKRILTTIFSNHRDSIYSSIYAIIYASIFLQQLFRHLLLPLLLCHSIWIYLNLFSILFDLHIMPDYFCRIICIFLFVYLVLFIIYYLLYIMKYIIIRLRFSSNSIGRCCHGQSWNQKFQDP